MKTIRLLSFISRVCLMIALVLGVFYWIAQIPVFSGLLVLLAQIQYRSIHEGFGLTGSLGLFVLGSVAMFTKGSRRLGAGSVIYALLMPAFGLTQTLILAGAFHWVIQAAHLLVGIGAMYLALGVEKRLRQFKLKEEKGTEIQPQGLIGRVAVLTSSTARGQGATDAQPQGRPYPPLVARLARAAVATHVSLYRLSGGRLGGQAQHMPVLLLTTTGRKSGRPRTTALVYLPDGDNYVVVASNGGQARLPNWWLNLRKSMQAQIEVGRKRLRVSAQEASGEERQRLWSRIVACRAGHEAYQKRTPYPLPLVILHPEEVLR